MQDLLLVFAVPLVVSLVLTRVMRSLAIRFRAIDLPDGWRKLHKNPVPLWGGVAVFSALTIGMLTARKAPVAYESQVDGLATSLFLSASMVFLLGFLDDRYDLRGRLKLLLQFVSVTPIVLGGYWFDTVVLFNHSIPLGWFGVALTMFWLVGAINALNLLDGMDGNASTAGAIACGAIALIAWQHDLQPVVLLSLAMLGAILGFLCYNLPSASIYLGDAGSTVIGLVVGFLGMQGARDGNGALRIAAPLVILTIPILDSSLAIVRRKLAGRRFDHADRGHIHHRLLDRGYNTWQALAIMGLLCLISGAAAVAASHFNSEPLGWLTSLAVIVCLAQFRFFGHHELALVRRAASALRGVMVDHWGWWTDRARYHALTRLSRWTFDEAWQALVGVMARLPATRLELCVWRDDRPVAAHSWTRSLDDQENGYAWRLSLIFGPRAGTRCELLVVGVDQLSREPRYLSHVARVLRVYGRYWLHHPERVEPGELQPLGTHVAPPMQLPKAA